MIAVLLFILLTSASVVECQQREEKTSHLEQLLHRLSPRRDLRKSSPRFESAGESVESSPRSVTSSKGSPREDSPRTKHVEFTDPLFDLFVALCGKNNQYLLHPTPESVVLARVRNALSNGAFLSARDHYQNNALSVAVLFDWPMVAHELLEKKIDTGAFNLLGWRAWDCCSAQNGEMQTLLKQYGAERHPTLGWNRTDIIVELNEQAITKLSQSEERKPYQEYQEAERIYSADPHNEAAERGYHRVLLKYGLASFFNRHFDAVTKTWNTAHISPETSASGSSSISSIEKMLRDVEGLVAHEAKETCS